MKAIFIKEFGGSEKLKWDDLPEPQITDHEVLIRTAYAGINPSDWMIREGLLKDYVPHEFPLILGMDVSGTIFKVGKEVREFKVGDEVFCYAKKPTIRWGTFAEFVACEAKNIAKKPKKLSLKEAASLPLIALTAWQSLIDAAHLRHGETLLILGGSGGVGSIAIQLAKSIQVKVLATSSRKKFDYVKKFGADFIIDYKEGIERQVHSHAKDGVDVLFDCAGGSSLKESLLCVKKGGRVVSVLEKLDPEEAKKRHITFSLVFTQPNGKELRQIAQLVDENKLIPPHIEMIHWKDAAQALETLRSGAVLGKLVLKFD